MGKVLGCAFILAIWAFFEALAAWLLMLAWNWVMPYLFKLPTINFWMALAILLILSLIGEAFKTRVTTIRS